MTEIIPKVMEYSKLYKEDCFLAWYSAGRPALRRKIEEILPKDEYGRQASAIIFSQWRRDNGWDVRADYLDARAISEAEDVAVQSKILMLKEHAARARQLQEIGQAYLEEMGMDSSASAVQAIIKGAELERTSRGMSAKLLQMLELDDDGLVSEVQKLLERQIASGDIIDVAEVEDEDAKSEE